MAKKYDIVAKYGESDAFRVTSSRFMRSHFDMDRFKKENQALVESFTDYREDGRMFVKERK